MRGSNIANVGAYPISFGPLAKGVEIMTSIYHVPAVHFRATAAITNTLPTRPYRSSGRPEVMFVMERLIDLAARQCGFDRLELRRRNLVPETAMPYRNPFGMVYDSGAYHKVMERVIALGGWASNSKYPLMGAMRSSAQMISYELSLTLSVVGVLMIANTLSLAQLVTSQQSTWLCVIPRWNIFLQPVAFLVYVVSAIAETNRLPFDLAESEQELVAGWHTEYSSLKFAMFMLAEYANMVTVSALATIMFLGGWSGPLFGPNWLQAALPTVWFVLKIFVFIFFYVLLRSTIPRFRYDQLMKFGWKVLLPLSLANILATSFIVAIS